MTIDELIVELQKKKQEYPGREIRVRATEGTIALEVAYGGIISRQPEDALMGRGRAGLWVEIAVPNR